MDHNTNKYSKTEEIKVQDGYTQDAIFKTLYHRLKTQI